MMIKKRQFAMQVFLIAILIATTLSCKLSTAASEGRNLPDSTPMAPVHTDPVHTDIEGLSSFIDLPMQPESVLWRVTKRGVEGSRMVPGPSDYKLEAVLTFSPENIQTIQDQSSAYALDWSVAWEESDFEAWYPDSVKQSFTFDAVTGKYERNGSVYEASEMFGTLSYSTGSFFVTDSGEIVLSLFSN